MKMDRRGWIGRGAAVALAAVVGACGGDAAANGSAGEAETFTRVVNVETATVEPERFVEVIRLTGTVEANQDVQVSAEETGVVREILVEKGNPVRTGQPILRIDDRVLRAQVEQARARADLAEETWQRRQRLFEEDAVGSELAYLEAKYAAEETRANLQTLEERLERTVVRAPLAGILDRRLVEVGTMVNAGTPVVRIVDLDPVKITAGVPERFAADVAPGAEAEVRLDAFSGRVFEGGISYVGASVDPGNRTFPVELDLPNPGRMIKPEMVAQISLVRRVRDDALVVPQEAIVRVEDGFVVFVVGQEDGGEVAVVTPVTTGPSNGNRVVVEEGLQPGDRVIVVGQQQVAHGDRVRIVGGSDR